jgi:hypothetical protein
MSNQTENEYFNKGAESLKKEGEVYVYIDGEFRGKGSAYWAWTMKSYHIANGRRFEQFDEPQHRET